MDMKIYAFFYTGTLLKGWRYPCAARHRTYGGCRGIPPLILKPWLYMKVSNQIDSLAALSLPPEITPVAY